MTPSPRGPAAARDYLTDYLLQAPAALALLRAIECRELGVLEFEEPLLDLGCGDGLFAQVFFEKRHLVGLDYSMKELLTARSRAAYDELVRADIAATPFPDDSFATVFSNGVLEHVENLCDGLREIARVLRPGGRLIFTVPTMKDELELSGAALLRGLGALGLAQKYADGYNRVFGQINVLDIDPWRSLLNECGLELTYHRAYASAAVFRLHDVTMLMSLPCFALKALTGRWVLFPGLRRLALAPLWAAVLRRLYDDADSPGCSLLMVATPAKSN